MTPIDPASAVNLGDDVVQRIDASLLLKEQTIEVTAFRDVTGLIPIDGIDGTPAETAVRVRLAQALAGAHLRRVETMNQRIMEMLDYVMSQVVVDGHAIIGPDGTPLIGDRLIEAYQHLSALQHGPEEATSAATPE